MAEVRPFRGIIYNAGKVGDDVAGVYAPPYDVIPQTMRDELYEGNDYNVIRLILGKDREGDNEQDNKYTRANRFLTEWMEEGVLVKDKDEAFYVYEQEYQVHGRKCRRIGFIGLMEIADAEKKKIFPHEHTLAAPREDRMNLMKEVKGNLSPIFTLYSDMGRTITEILEKTVVSVAPLVDIQIGMEGHKLWRLRDKSSLEKISSSMEGKRIFIADGHHRYEVARKYRDMMRQQPGYDGSADHIMMYFTDMEASGNLTIMGTHRVIKDMELADDEIVERLKKYFYVTRHRDLADLISRLDKKSGESHAFGFFGGNGYLFIELKNESDIEKLIVEKKSLEWKKLDVSILHSAVFNGLLDIKNEEGKVKYVRDPEEAVSLVRNSGYKGVFFLNPTRVEQLKAVAERGDMMPQKSTYFYPKLLSGLVLNKF